MNLQRQFAAPGWRLTVNEQDSVVAVRRISSEGPRHFVVTVGSASEATLTEKRRLDRAYVKQMTLFGAGGFTAMALLLIVLSMPVGWSVFTAPPLFIILALGAGLWAALWFPRSADAAIPGAPVIGISPEDEDLLFTHISDRDRQALTSAIERGAGDAVLEELARMIVARIRDDLERVAKRDRQQAQDTAAAIMKRAHDTAAAILDEHQGGRDHR